MFYVKHILESGKKVFVPIRDNNLYVYCDYCEKMVCIRQPAKYIKELLLTSDSIECGDLCCHCYDRNKVIKEVAQEWKSRNPQHNTPSPEELQALINTVNNRTIEKEKKKTVPDHSSKTHNTLKRNIRIIPPEKG